MQFSYGSIDGSGERLHKAIPPEKESEFQAFFDQELDQIYKNLTRTRELNNLVVVIRNSPFGSVRIDVELARGSDGRRTSYVQFLCRFEDYIAPENLYDLNSKPSKLVGDNKLAIVFNSGKNRRKLERDLKLVEEIPVANWYFRYPMAKNSEFDVRESRFELPQVDEHVPIAKSRDRKVSVGAMSDEQREFSTSKKSDPNRNSTVKNLVFSVFAGILGGATFLAGQMLVDSFLENENTSDAERTELVELKSISEKLELLKSKIGKEPPKLNVKLDKDLLQEIVQDSSDSFEKAVESALQEKEKKDESTDGFSDKLVLVDIYQGNVNSRFGNSPSVTRKPIVLPEGEVWIYAKFKDPKAPSMNPWVTLNLQKNGSTINSLDFPGFGRWNKLEVNERDRFQLEFRNSGSDGSPYKVLVFQKR